eukprot:CAMPEP_0178431650 /NCGR_PEP_ID=MMETSP0689_2-20121128/31965_1 /TAXON_ID=160604 /ORGANISM="Amphidinium massartii, Strain CS-259" /LENGTH=250 /DNA_ID=CAMNT_0020053585 /DNA_START=87 /DNA_END=839 /DNA_ORIENTATION=-
MVGHTSKRSSVLAAAAATVGLSAFSTAPLFAAPLSTSTRTSSAETSILSRQTASVADAGLAAPVLAGVAGAAVVMAAQSAKASVRSSRAGRAATFKPSEQVGAMAPLGYFDPLGFCKDGEEETFRELRAAEIKHGRVAMMASIGLVGQELFQLPGVSEWGAGNGVMAATTLFGQWGLIAIFIWSGNLELIWKEDPNKAPGNFGDPLGLAQYDTDMRNREINNGRFAMICVTGIIAAELATGKTALQQFSF